jgi:two-component system, NarL family, sensor kinase
LTAVVQFITSGNIGIDPMKKLHHPCSIVVILVAMILGVEILVPNEYIVGYAYVIPVILASYQLNLRWAKWTTAISIALTLLYCFDRDHLYLHTISRVVLFNRLLAACALLVAYQLSIKARTNGELATNRQAELVFQSRLTEIKTDFSANLVHDLQNPLFGAIETINTFLLGEFGAVTTAQQHALEIMSRSHKMSIHNLQTILETCHNDNHGLYLNYQTSNLKSIATDAIETLVDLAKSRQVQIECVNESQTTEIECDPDKIDRVFANLLLNAINQSLPHSKIVVSISSEIGQYSVRVSDQGRGITAKDLPYIFVKYYQGLIGRRTKGAGLGLYLVRQIIETHGGTIQVEPKVEKGVTFLFTLPKLAAT